MTVPCDKGPILDEIKSDVKAIHQVVTDLALQNQRISSLETISVDHEGRIRKIERTPLKMLLGLGALIGSIITALVSGFFAAKFWS